MKNAIKMLTWSCFAAALFLATACGGNATKNEHAGHDHDAPAATETAATEYYCPMKCEGEKPYTDPETKCPVCGMALVLKED